MNNATGSALQKISFVLVLFIAAAAGYLIVRERIRSQQREAEAAAALTATNATSTAAVPSRAEAMPAKPSYAPFRPRIETNVVRIGSNRTVALPPPASDRVVIVDNARPTTSARATAVVPLETAVVGSDGGRGSASVTGRAILLGNAPPEKVIATDPTCGALRRAPLMTRLYVVGEGGALGDVFVYIKAGAPATPAPNSGKLLLDQVGCEYLPYIVGVQTGQTFTVRNSDPLFHNVHAIPKHPAHRERSIAQPVKGTTTSFAFSAREVFVTFKCDVHPWMFAYVGVVEHPWFAVTDKNGNFTLPGGLPPGPYTLAAVHRKAGEQTQQIHVTAEGVPPVTFTFEVPEESKTP